MANDTPLKYLIQTEINKEKIIDIQSFSVFRCPIAKTASFAIINLNITGTNYLFLEADVRDTKLAMLPINIYQVNPAKQINKSNYEEAIINTMCCKMFKILQVKANEPLDLKKSYISCTIYLANPVLHYLFTHNSFNKVLKNVTGLEAIEAYEAFLKSNYGSAFDFRKIGADIEKNEYKHEHLLIRVSNDLTVGPMMIQNYKPNDTYAIYFLDDFRVDEDTKADITGYYINLADNKVFPQRDIMDAKYKDSVGMLNYEGSHNIADPHSELKQTNQSIMIEDKEGTIKSTKSTAMVDVPFIQTEMTEVTMSTSGKKIMVPQTTISTQQKPATEMTRLYSSDNPDVAMARFGKVQKQFQETIQSVDTYFIKECHFDFFQFGYCYNLQANNISSFSYTPLSIVNNFIRDNFGYVRLIHNSYVQFIKFKEPEE